MPYSACGPPWISRISGRLPRRGRAGTSPRSAGRPPRRSPDAPASASSRLLQQRRVDGGQATLVGAVAYAAKTSPGSVGVAGREDDPLAAAVEVQQHPVAADDGAASSRHPARSRPACTLPRSRDQDPQPLAIRRPDRRQREVAGPHVRQHVAADRDVQVGRHAGRVAASSRDGPDPDVRAGRRIDRPAEAGDGLAVRRPGRRVQAVARLRQLASPAARSPAPSRCPPRRPSHGSAARFEANAIARAVRRPGRIAVVPVAVRDLARLAAVQPDDEQVDAAVQEALPVRTMLDPSDLAEGRRVRAVQDRRLIVRPDPRRRTPARSLSGLQATPSMPLEPAGELSGLAAIGRDHVELAPVSPSRSERNASQRPSGDQLPRGPRWCRWSTGGARRRRTGRSRSPSGTLALRDRWSSRVNATVSPSGERRGRSTTTIAARSSAVIGRRWLLGITTPVARVVEPPGSDAASRPLAADIVLSRGARRPVRRTCDSGRSDQVRPSLRRSDDTGGRVTSPGSVVERRRNRPPR